MKTCVAYKLLPKNMTARGMTYRVGKWMRPQRVIQKPPLELCEPGVLHFYRHPLLAALLAREVHGLYGYTQLYRAVAGGHIAHRGDKSGCTKLKLVRRIPAVRLTRGQWGRMIWALIMAVARKRRRGTCYFGMVADHIAELAVSGKKVSALQRRNAVRETHIFSLSEDCEDLGIDVLEIILPIDAKSKRRRR